jgi:poly-gamma-glutamate synthesis protein (capsule biosynthesis protein)
MDKIMLSGSVVLRQIFERQKEIPYDMAGLLISPVSLFSAAYPDPSVRLASAKVKIDIDKSFEEYIASSDCDYIAVDFYSAVAISLYKLGDSLFTASDQFKRSEFFNYNKHMMTRIAQPIERKLWQKPVEQYACALRKRYGKNIILLRLSFSHKAVKHSELRTTAAKVTMNKQLKEMEECFIDIADPIVIDVSEKYFRSLDDSSPSAYEPDFYKHIHKILKEIADGSEKRLYSDNDNELFIQRSIRYYDSMTARAFQNWMLDGVSAADLLIRYSSKQFVAENAHLFLRLKNDNIPLAEVKQHFEYDSDTENFILAAQAVDTLLQNDISKPYRYYSVIFRKNLNAVTLITGLLSEQLGKKIAAHECETVFLLKDKPELLRQYFERSATIAVDIWGSCVCRESVNRSCKEISVNKYIFKQPCVLAFEPEIPCEIPQAVKSFGGSTWRRRAAPFFAFSSLFSQRLLSMSSPARRICSLSAAESVFFFRPPPAEDPASDFFRPLPAEDPASICSCPPPRSLRMLSSVFLSSLPSSSSIT